MSSSLHLIAQSYHLGKPLGLTSVCSAHPFVIEAALRLAMERNAPALIEATCNQVNQDGGYTGMTPEKFRAFVESISENISFPCENIIFGGDHLGPNPWRHLPAAQAMAKAEALIAAFAKAGFTKLHLDTSMGCLGEPAALQDQLTAQRAASLAKIAEQNAVDANKLVYVIGTEVPPPGGAHDTKDCLQITKAESIFKTYKLHQEAFILSGLESAFSRVIALVVQPGVEFSHDQVIHFNPRKAAELSLTLKKLPGLVFEAHSTDYQTKTELKELIENGFAILKVGPWLTFALREALYALDAIADVLDGFPPQSNLMKTMEAKMLKSPENWQHYYAGSENDLWLQRHFSYSDRIRYYWSNPDIEFTVSRLINRLDKKVITPALISQYIPSIEPNGKSFTAKEILIETVQRVLRQYAYACGHS